jgi:hypothetical protein
MMSRFAAVLCAVVLWASGSGTASAAPVPPRAGATDYVRVTEWARWQGLKWRWLKRDKSFQLTNTAARIQFATGSREAYYNGLQLWLLHPLVTRGNEIYISQLDVDFTISAPCSRRRGMIPGKKSARSAWTPAMAVAILAIKPAVARRKI